MIFVDSSVWVDYFNGKQSVETDCLDSLPGKEPVGLGDVVLVEVLQGFRRDQDYKTAKDLLTVLAVFTLGGQEMAIKSADNQTLESGPFLQQLGVRRILLYNLLPPQKKRFST